MEYMMTPNFRVSFPVLDKAAQILDSGDPKFSLTMIFDTVEIAKDPAQQKLWDAMVASVDSAAKEKFGEMPKVFKKPFLKGDEQVSQKTGEPYDGYAGCVILRTTAGLKSRPALVGPDKSGIDAAEIYSGCYARAKVRPYGWDFAKKGVSFGLGNVQKVRDGEALGGGGTSAEDDFDAIESVDTTTAGADGLFD